MAGHSPSSSSIIRVINRELLPSYRLYRRGVLNKNMTALTSHSRWFNQKPNGVNESNPMTAPFPHSLFFTHLIRNPGHDNLHTQTSRSESRFILNWPLPFASSVASSLEKTKLNNNRRILQRIVYVALCVWRIRKWLFFFPGTSRCGGWCGPTGTAAGERSWFYNGARNSRRERTRGGGGVRSYKKTRRNRRKLLLFGISFFTPFGFFGKSFMRPAALQVVAMDARGARANCLCLYSPNNESVFFCAAGPLAAMCFKRWMRSVLPCCASLFFFSTAIHLLAR